MEEGGGRASISTCMAKRYTGSAATGGRRQPSKRSRELINGMRERRAAGDGEAAAGWWTGAPRGGAGWPRLERLVVAARIGRPPGRREAELPGRNIEGRCGKQRGARSYGGRRRAVRRERRATTRRRRGRRRPLVVRGRKKAAMRNRAHVSYAKADGERKPRSSPMGGTCRRRSWGWKG